MTGHSERDAEGNLTDWALAVCALEDHGCDCGQDEPGTCLACVCSAALTTERANRVAAENATLLAVLAERDRCAKVCEARAEVSRIEAEQRMDAREAAEEKP